MRRPLSLSLASFLIYLGLNWYVQASPPVKVRLRSSWPAPNLFLEVLESASNEHHDAFFPMLDLLTSPELFTEPLATLSKEAIHDASVQTLLSNGYLCEPGALDTFELSLALHAASPKLEAFYQYYQNHELARTPLVEGELSDDCSGSWVAWYGLRVCSVDTLRHLVETMTLEPSDNSTQFVPINPSKILSFDHVYPPASTSLETPSKIAILYGNVTSPNFHSLHGYLYSLASDNPPRLQYVFRHLPPASVQTTQSHLSGYGVSLDLKKMDYLALDDRKHTRGAQSAGTAKDARASETEELESDPVLDALGERDDEVDLTTPLDEEEVDRIAIKSTQLVMNSPEPLNTLMHLSQNFPKYATSVARRVEVDPSLSEELELNSVKASPGANMVWLNGMVLQETDINLFGLVRLLRKERETICQLTAGDLSAPQAVDLLTHSAIMMSQGGNRVTDGMFDSSDRHEGGDVIVWWNDIEKDSRYAQWSPSLQMMLRPTFPGQFHTVKRNLYNTVLLLDLSQPTSLAWVTGAVSNIIQRGLPFRFGVIPLIENEDGMKAARLLYYLIDTYGRSKTMNFFSKLQQTQGQTIDFNMARVEFDALDTQADAQEEDVVFLDFDAVVGSSKSPQSQDLEISVEKARLYAKRLGANVKSSPGGHAFVNGKHLDVSDEFLRSLQMEIAQQTQYLQEQIYIGALTEDVDASVYFYDLPTTVKRRNRHIYPTSQASSLQMVNLPEVFGSAKLETTSDFVYPIGGAASNSTPISMWVIADFDEPAGEALLKASLSALTENASFRLAFVHNPSNRTARNIPASDSLSYRLSLLHSASFLNRTSAADLLAVLVGWPPVQHNDQVVLEKDLTLKSILSSASEDTNRMAYVTFCGSSRLLAHELRIVPGEQILLVNGRLVGPIGENEFDAEDFQLLVDYETSKRVGPIVEAYTEILGDLGEDVTREKFSHDIAMLSSIVSASQIPDPSAEGLFNIPHRPRNRAYLLLDHALSSFTFGDNSTAAYQFAFLLDPLSEQASRWTPLISWLSALESVYVHVHLNPASSLKELPLKQFYRYNLQPRLTFDESGNEIISDIEFKDLPPDPIYTLGMDVPPAWLVRPHDSHHDLDNIRLSSFVGADKVIGVEAVFDLDYIVVEGHARDSVTNGPPRGLQLQLTTSNSTPVADTQVVANLGYLQFKVKPGVFELDIREGYGREVFEMESVGNEGWNSLPIETAGVDITVTSLEGLTLYPRFHKRPGMETADVLAEPMEEESSGLMDQVVSGITSLIWPQKEVVVSKPQADINIFTVASGLLYERFVSIMILSVLRNTNSTVKFWFIENFLSPSFLEFIPHLAEAYNFQYELVTYKWPSWLRAQKEKQRVIWGYKILFLDVLFPMDLKKVIFVDADQIVRADLQELVDLDLHGAPYGYTPMGDDNTEMEGFRFWKTGYWKEFLGPKPYHISALYVIDLVRFRQLAAGDRLRASYQTLSQDPNSLSNLDQDLPNNLQHEVPIFSLPEDWLWCETWCSKDRLHRAKTIDLCQNPLTKEPKLSRARQIPEWEEYDAEIAQFARKLADNGIIRSAAYTSGVDELANLGASDPEKEKAADPEEESEMVQKPHVDGTVRRDEL